MAASEYLVGLSGKTVNPKVYIACGMSGTAQHLAGMADSHLIIAINKDANAAIFNIAHYAIVGDLFQIIPAFIEAAPLQFQPIRKIGQSCSRCLEEVILYTPLFKCKIEIFPIKTNQKKLPKGRTDERDSCPNNSRFNSRSQA